MNNIAKLKRNIISAGIGVLLKDMTGIIVQENGNTFEISFQRIWRTHNLTEIVTLYPDDFGVE